MAKKKKKKVAKKVAKKKALKKKHKVQKVRAVRVQYHLPEERKTPVDDFFRYATLIYGRAGIGKTTFVASFPDAILFSCERVSKKIACFDFNTDDGGPGVNTWEVFKAGVKLLENSDRFTTVAVDTIDAAYAHCFDYVCRKRGIEHPTDEGYGKAWSAVEGEFTGVMDALWETGRGIVFTSHAKEVQITSHSGEEYTRIQPTMAGQAYQFIKAKSDFVFYAEYVKNVTKNCSQRILITTGDEVVEAKHAGDLPPFLPFLEGAEGVRIVQDAFSGENVGIDLANIKPGKKTSKASGKMIAMDKVKVARGAASKKKVAKKKVAKKKVLKRR